MTAQRDAVVQLHVTLTATKALHGQWRALVHVHPGAVGSSGGRTLRSASVRALDRALVARHEEARHA